MYNRRDTALEAWAEEMREKKASGKLNTKALLAALDADSSSSDGSDGSDHEVDVKPKGGEPAVDRGSAMGVLMLLLKRKQAKEKLAREKIDM